EDLWLEDEKPTIDAHIRFIHGLQTGDLAVAVGRDHVIAEVWSHGEKTGNFVMTTKVFHLVAERKVGHSIAVVRQEFFFRIDIGLRRLQPLADVGVYARIDKRDAPVLNVTIEQL